MGIKTVTDEIVSEAKREAARIVEGVEEEAARLIEEKKSELARDFAAAESAIESWCASRQRIVLAKAASETKKLRLEKTRGFIDLCFDEAHKLIKNLTKKEKVEMAKKLMAKAGSGFLIYADPEIASLLPGKVRKKKIEGIIAESADGSIVMDLTADTMLESIKEKRMKEIMRILG